ncbi:hypothetical protein ANO11243_041420 [Dothideomycetidae sp. 11243]|nr:hypothetical protein ANO11243_041420 [fungal sp. No.11243]
MIIHVVIPDTKAASEPRWTAAKKDPEELSERSKSKAKWATKGTTTVFDKLRSDFPPATKGASEKVAQIRLSRDNVPQSFLPSIVVPSDLVETAQELSNAWHDLVAKFKTLILQSFDRRVSQYEDDIREKEAQRALPGWNFCTFFTLKENLARGFESVGLVEDALAIYDELEAGLESSAGNNSTILGDMASLRSELSELASSSEEQQNLPGGHEHIMEILATPFDLSRHDFRTLIVSSTISLFDFHTYIFARQRTLIYRLGLFEPLTSPDAARLSRDSAIQRPRSDEQLIHIAEVCQRAASYISTNARTLRKELESATESSDQAKYETIVHNIAAAWGFTMSKKILAETAIPLDSINITPGHNLSPNSFNFAQGANSYPARRSSLMSLTSLASPSGSTVIYENEKLKQVDDADGAKPAPPGSGLSELAASRGELCLLQRRFLETLAETMGWKSGWAAREYLTSIAASEPGHGIDGTAIVEAPPRTMTALLDKDPLAALNSMESFRGTYESLARLAIKYLISGNRLSSAENLFSDIALLKYQAGDYTGAAQIFAKLIPKFMINRWPGVETQTLTIYIDCLRKLNRRDEYVRMSLGLLRSDATRDRELESRQTEGLGNKSIKAESATSLQKLVDFSKNAHNPYRAPLEDMFDDFEVGNQILHDDREDGFVIRVRMRSQIQEHAFIDSVKLKLVNTAETSQEIWLENEGPVEIGPGMMTALLRTRTTAWGLYTVRQVQFEMGRLHFSHNFEPKQVLTPFGADNSQSDPTGPLIVVYPRSTALDVSIGPNPDIHVDKARSFHVQLTTGSLGYDSLLVRFKPATAGLRLHNANAEVVVPRGERLVTSNSQGLQLDPKTSNHWTIRIPYSLESPQLDLTVKAEITATRDGHDYVFLFEEELPIDLHLDVDVNDTFKPDNLFSQFSVRTTNEDPLVVHSIHVSGSGMYSVIPLDVPSGLPVFEKQPVSLACMISKTNLSNTAQSAKKENALQLTVEYYPIANVIIQLFTDLFEISCNRSALVGLRRFFLPTMKRLLNERLKSDVLEEAVLVGECEIPSYQSFGWEEYVSALPNAVQTEARAWLQSWHEFHPTLALDLSSLPGRERRSITVPVDVPTIDVLATASLSLETTVTASESLPPVAFVGQPLKANLAMSMTHRWSADNTPRSTKTKLVYNILETPDWLLAGPSTATFDIGEDETMSFPLLLIPLVPGSLAFPHVDVQLAHVPAEPDTAPVARTVLENNGRGRYACETDYESAAESVLVLRPPADTEYSIGDAVTSHSGGGALMGLGVRMDSEDGRQDEDGKWWLHDD